MTKEEQQAKMAELKKAPKFVRHAASIILLLGLITLIRMTTGAYAAHLSVGKAAFFGVVMFIWFLLCGGYLFNRSRQGYIGLAVISLLPLPGLLAWSLHLLRLILESNVSESWPVTIHCAICFVQLIVTVVLFGFLLTGEVRNYVWKPQPSTP